MTRIWLSQRLAGGRDEVAELLGPAASIAAGGPFPPAGTDLAVASCFEHPLLDALAGLPAELAPGALVVVAPPGIPVTEELARAHAQVFATATTPAEVAAVLRDTLSAAAPGAAPAWRAPTPSAGGGAPMPGRFAPARRHLVAKVLAGAALVVALGFAFAVALPGAGTAAPAPAGYGASATTTSDTGQSQVRPLVCLDRPAPPREGAA